jgi:septum formation protein
MSRSGSHSAPLPIVLASSSPYRKGLLAKLGLPFDAVSPVVDETPQVGEAAAALAVRLAKVKSTAVAPRFSRHLIIGSDQVAMLGTQRLSKPGDRENAIRQLRMVSERCVRFYTGVCVLRSVDACCLSDLDESRVHFKKLTPRQIENYVDRDEPFNCAAAFKSESLGIALCEKIEVSDPNALIGLPLIRLIKLLEKFDVHVI